MGSDRAVAGHVGECVKSSQRFGQRHAAKCRVPNGGEAKHRPSDAELLAVPNVDHSIIKHSTRQETGTPPQL